MVIKTSGLLSMSKLINLPFLVMTSILWAGQATGAELKQEDICKAAIATLNGHSPLGRAQRQNTNTITIKYKRPNDGKKFQYWCLFNGSTIRWKDEYSSDWSQNSHLIYSVDAKKLRITFFLQGEAAETRIFGHTDFN